MIGAGGRMKKWKFRYWPNLATLDDDDDDEEALDNHANQGYSTSLLVQQIKENFSPLNWEGFKTYFITF